MIASLVALLPLPPLLQDQAYHQFADQRELFGIPNFWNVVSNLPDSSANAWRADKFQCAASANASAGCHTTALRPLRRRTYLTTRADPKTRSGAVTSAVLVHYAWTGPLWLALAGATRSGTADVGSPYRDPSTTICRFC
jgi:hypothetical protein